MRINKPQGFPYCLQHITHIPDSQLMSASRGKKAGKMSKELTTFISMFRARFAQHFLGRLQCSVNCSLKKNDDANDFLSFHFKHQSREINGGERQREGCCHQYRQICVSRAGQMGDWFC